MIAPAGPAPGPVRPEEKAAQALENRHLADALIARAAAPLALLLGAAAVVMARQGGCDWMSALWRGELAAVFGVLIVLALRKFLCSALVSEPPVEAEPPAPASKPLAGRPDKP